jgi:hypothetical protein
MHVSGMVIVHPQEVFTVGEQKLVRVISLGRPAAGRVRLEL